MLGVWGLAPNSLCSLRSRRSDKRREVSRRSALTRAAPNPCAPRRLPRGPRAIRRSLREHSIHTSVPMRSEACGEEIAACVRLVQGMAWTGRTHVAEARRPNEERLCFGYFHLTRQMFAQRGDAHFAKQSYAATKVTRPPGRNPGAPAGRQKKHTTQQRHNQSKASVPQPERLIVKTAPRCQS